MLLRRGPWRGGGQYGFDLWLRIWWPPAGPSWAPSPSRPVARRRPVRLRPLAPHLVAAAGPIVRARRRLCSPGPLPRVQPARCGHALHHASMGHRMRHVLAADAPHGHGPCGRAYGVPHRQAVRERARAPAGSTYPAPRALGTPLCVAALRVAALRVAAQPQPTRGPRRGVPLLRHLAPVTRPQGPSARPLLLRGPADRPAQTSSTFQGDDSEHVRSTSGSNRASHATRQCGVFTLCPSWPYTSMDFPIQAPVLRESRCIPFPLAASPFSSSIIAN